MTTPLLLLQDVSLRRGERDVLLGVSLALATGDIVAVLGPSGAGKSSLLQVMLGLEAPSTGVVLMGGQETSRAGEVIAPAHARGLGVVFQDLALWPHLSVRQHLEFVLRAQRVPRAAWRQRTEDLLGRVGLTDKSERRPGELSGGERQRVAIARALVGSPRAILFDEPLANLDAVLKRELLTLFAELLRARGLAALYVTHDLREATLLAERIIVLEAGRVTYDGPASNLAEHPATAFIEAIVESR